MADKLSELVKTNTKGKQLNTNAMVAFKRPQTLSALRTNYKILAHRIFVEKGISHPCGGSMLCDRGGEDGMIKKTDYIKLKTGKITKFK